MYAVLLRDKFDCSVKLKTWIYDLRIRKQMQKKKSKKEKKERKRRMKRGERGWDEQDFMLYFRECKVYHFSSILNTEFILLLFFSEFQQ